MIQKIKLNSEFGLIIIITLICLKYVVCPRTDFITNDQQDLLKNILMSINSKIGQKTQGNFQVLSKNLQSEDGSAEVISEDTEIQSQKQLLRQLLLNQSPEQDSYRMKVFERNAGRVKRHNRQEHNYTTKLNQFAYLTGQQFKKSILMTYLGPKPKIVSPPMAPPPGFQISAIDWRGTMKKVRHQGKCGSCWAFSITGVLQAYIYIERGQNAQLSEQHLLDCCRKGCNGCRGGWPVSAINYITKNGLALSEQYPYKAKAQKCIKDVQTSQYLDTQGPYMHVNTVDGLAFAVQSGPVSVIIDASSWDPLYQTGIFDQCPDQSDVNYNHAVILVGISQPRAWIIRNSWGSQWGDDGHIYLPYGNSCGVADMGIVPFLS